MNDGAGNSQAMHYGNGVTNWYQIEPHKPTNVSVMPAAS
jgi:hypothetical protein